jgi:hypothetical protein
MHQTIAAMSFEEFVTLIPVGVLTADEIAEKIGSYRPRSLGGAENLQLAKAVQAWLQAWAGGPPSGDRFVPHCERRAGWLRYPEMLLYR